MEMSAGVGLEVGNGFNLDSWDGNMDQMELSMWPGASVCQILTPLVWICSQKHGFFQQTQ